MAGRARLRAVENEETRLFRDDFPLTAEDAAAGLTEPPPATREELLARAKSFGEERDLLKDELDVKEPFVTGEDEMLLILAQLSETIPSHAFLTTLRIRERTISLSGYSKAPMEVVDLLEKSPYFENVSFSNLNPSFDDYSTFNLTLERVPAELVAAPGGEG
jgi:Tfp pilus assembly protein PilN